jgi:hypothetical protein
MNDDGFMVIVEMKLQRGLDADGNPEFRVTIPPRGSRIEMLGMLEEAKFILAEVTNRGRQL